MIIIPTKLIAAYRTKVFPNYWDILALVLVFALFTFLAWNAKQMAIPYHTGQSLPISLDPALLPFYAARTIMRMLIALVISLLFTFIFGTWAAKSRRAERIIIPMIDVLQSVPILGFLSVTITAFIALFPGSLLGPESAVIFVVFTSQAWNMAFSFYQTVKSVPTDIKEAATVFRVSAWQRFWLIEVPFSMPGLLWNTMMSMSGGWFFVVAAEAITVSNQTIMLPGIGSYIASAINSSNIHAIVYAVLTMFIVIIIYDQLLFRPLVAWAEKFKVEQEGDEKKPRSWVIAIFHRTHMMRYIGRKFAFLFDVFVNIKIFLTPKTLPEEYHNNIRNERLINHFWNVLTIIIGLGALFYVSRYIANNIVFSEVKHVLMLGLVTASRVFILIILSTLIWVPIGVWIGLKPKISEIGQPVAQLLAAFPANLLYPFIVIPIATYHLNPNIWLTPLMILGAQWYILFNVIAGASTIPKDLLQTADNFKVWGWLRWRRLILPAIFPYYITGALTAAGGAWNASIVAEVASWGKIKLEAVGLGAYITEYTNAGDFPRIVLGVGIMCLLVLIINRSVWRPLYRYAIDHFSLE
jgi:NitT/TauT family transport system permease protein